MDQSQNPSHIQMDSSSVVLTPVLGKTSAMVSFDTDTLIATCQSAAWKISRWPDNIAIHHTKGCDCCHEYINHLFRLRALGKSTYCILMLRMQYKVPGPCSLIASKLMLRNAYRDKSAICSNYRVKIGAVGIKNLEYLANRNYYTIN